MAFRSVEVEYPGDLKRALFDARLEQRRGRAVLAWWLAALVIPLAIIALCVYAEIAWITDPDDEGIIAIPVIFLGVLPIVVIAAVIINHTSTVLIPSSRRVRIAEYELRDYWDKAGWSPKRWVDDVYETGLG